MPNELDMDTYHQSEIEPGEHKVFNIAPTIHTFNERFQGEDQSFPSMLTPGFDPSKMPDWWVRQVTPKPFYSQYGSPEPIPNTSEDEPSVPLQPIPIHPSKGYLPTSESELKSYRPTFRDMLRGWLRGTSPSPERAQIVDQLLGHTEAEEQTGIHKLNIGDIIDMQPEEMIGTGVIGPRTLIGSKMFNEVIKELVKRGHSFNDIANFLETTRGSIAGRVKRMGIKSSEDERSTRSYYSPSQESLPGTKRFDESLSDWMKNQFKGGPVEPEKLTLEEKIQAFQKKYGYDKKPVSTSDDVEYSRRQERLLTEIPELRQTPFHPENQAKMDEWVKSLSYSDYLKMLDERLKPPESFE